MYHRLLSTFFLAGILILPLSALPAKAIVAVPNNDTATESECLTYVTVSYGQSIREAGQKLRRDLLAAFDAQVLYRLKAPLNRNRVNTVRNSLAQARTRLSTGLDTFVTTQARGAGQEADAALDRPDVAQIVSAPSLRLENLPTVLKNAETNLRLYASTADRVVITRILAQNQKNILDTYKQTRQTAYASLQQAQQTCFEDDTSTTTDEPASSETAPPSASIPNEYTLRAVVLSTPDNDRLQPQNTCRLSRIFKATLSSDHELNVSYRWEFSDGQVGPTQTTRLSSTTIEGSIIYQKTVEYTRTWESGALGSARIVVLSPRRTVAEPAPFSLTCTSSGRSPVATTVLDAALVNVSKLHTTQPTTDCRQTIDLTATLSSNGTISKVDYHWEFDDGTVTPTQSVTFDTTLRRMQLKNVTYSHTINRAKIGAVRLVITSPYSITSKSFSYSLQCEDTPSANTTTLGRLEIHMQGYLNHEEILSPSACQQAYDFRAFIIADKAVNVQYRWEYTDGQTSPLQTARLTADDTPNTFSAGVETRREWATGTLGAVRLVVVSPQKAVSKPSSYSIICNPAITPRVEGVIPTNYYGASLTGGSDNINVRKPKSDCRLDLSSLASRVGHGRNDSSTIQYHWEFSDGTVTPTQSVDLRTLPTNPNPLLEDKEIPLSRQITRESFGAVRFVITSPLLTYSRSTEFSLQCE